MNTTLHWWERPFSLTSAALWSDGATPKAFIPIEDVPTDNSGSVHHVTEGLLMFWVCSNL